MSSTSAGKVCHVHGRQSCTGCDFASYMELPASRFGAWSELGEHSEIDHLAESTRQMIFRK